MMMRCVPLFVVVALAASGAHAEETAANPHTLCAQRSDAALDALGDARFEAATAGFDAALRARYGAARLASDWNALPSRYGRLLGRGRGHDGDIGGQPVVMTPLIFERGTLTVEMHCDSAGAVTDFRLDPTQAMH